jgi:hypothetical protein
MTETAAAEVAPRAASPGGGLTPGGRLASAIIAAAGVLLALAAAWAIPSLAIPVVWPLLFLVPGWGILAATQPRIAATGRLGLAIVLSVALSAHLVYWLSLATGGYRRETIFAVAVLLALPIPLVAARGGLPALGAPIRAAWRSVRREPAGFVLGLLAAAFVAAVLAAGMWRTTADGINAGGSNWSDLGVHLSIAQSLNAGNFPPQVPYFAGVPLVYHWFADFHAAIAARAAGIFAVPSFIAGSAILAGALALLVHGLALHLLHGDRARRAALLAVVLVIFAGGLGWVRLIGDMVNGFGDLPSLVTHNSYDNSWLTEWPYFRIPSVMGTGLLVHRATTAGLPMLVGAVLLLLVGLPTAQQRAAGWRDRPVLIGLAGLLGALLAPFHFFFFPAFPALALLWAAVGGRLIDRDAPRNALILLAPYLLAIPFAVAPLLQAAGSGQLRWVTGWESAPFADGPAAVVFFYVSNLGAPFVLALAALFARRTPRRAFLAAWIALLFLVPNVVQASAIGFDMNKYFQAMWVGVALLAAWLIRRWPAPAVAVVLLLSIPSPLLVSAWTAFNRSLVLTTSEAAAANWIAANTPERSVFVTNGWLNSPTDPAGRLRLLTYTPYVANLGYSPDLRSAQIDAIYCSGNATAGARLARTLGASYLIDTGPPTQNCPLRTVFGGNPDWTLAYADAGITIWRLADGGTALLRPASVSSAQ